MVHWNLEPQQRHFKPLLTHFLQLSSTSGGSTCGSKVVTANKPRSQAKMTNFVGNKSSTIDISRLQLQPQSAHQCNAMQRCGGLHLPFSPVPCTSTDAPQTSPCCKLVHLGFGACMHLFLCEPCLCNRREQQTHLHTGYR